MSWLANFLKPHRTIPVTPWTGKSRWDLSVERVAILWFGLTIFGFGDALIVNSLTGNEATRLSKTVKILPVKPSTPKAIKSSTKKKGLTAAENLRLQLNLAQNEMSTIQTQLVALRSTTTNVGWAAIAADGSPIGFTSFSAAAISACCV